MTKPVILTNFTGGELSRKMDCRPDLEKYLQGLILGENMHCIPQGGQESRSGTRFVSTTKDNEFARLIPFEYNVEQAYALLFGNANMRVFMDGAQVEYVIEGQDEWNDATVYSVGDTCKYEGIIYRCIKDIVFGDITETSNAICNSYYYVDDGGFSYSFPPSRAFDNNIANSPILNWYVAGEEPGNIAYNSWIGQEDITEPIKTIRILQPSNSNSYSSRGVSSVVVQSYYDNNWHGGELIEIDLDSDEPLVWGEKTVVTPIEGEKIRIKAITEPADGKRWGVVEVEMIPASVDDYITKPAPAPASDPDHWVADPGLEIVTPYSSDEVLDLQFAQSADVMYLVHPDYPPYKLSRSSHTNWTIEEINFTKGPLRNENTEDITLAASATTGTGVTLTASGGSVFDSDMVGSLFKISHYVEEQFYSGDLSATGTTSLGTVYPDSSWRVTSHGTWTGKFHIEKSMDGGATWYKVFSIRSADDNNANATGDEDSADGAMYRLNVSEYTSGTIEYEFSVDPRTHEGYVEITSVTNGTLAKGTVITDLYSTDATDLWAEGSWSTYRGFPATTTIHENRVCYAGVPGDPQKIYGTVIDDYENMELSADDDAAIILPFGADEVSGVRWLLSKSQGGQSDLLFGTLGGTWSVRHSSDSALSASNATVQRNSNEGCADLNAILAQGYVLYVSRDGKRVKQIVYDYDSDSYLTNDITLLSEGVTGTGLTTFVYQKEPIPLVFGVREDGQVAVLSFIPSQKIAAWSRYILGGSFGDGDAVVESMCVLPSQTWFVVKRTINGSTVRYVEYSEDWDETLDNAYFVDSAVKVVNSPSSATVTGFSHLIGESLSGLADGVPFSGKVVNDSGEITLDEPATTIIAGLPFLPRGQTTDIDWQDRVRSVLGSHRKILSLRAKFYKTNGCRVGESADNLYEIDTFNEGELYTGSKSILWDGPTEGEQRIYFEQPYPLPFCILGFILEVEDQTWT